MLNLATVDKPGLVSYMPELVLYYYKWDCPIKTLMILCKGVFPPSLSSLCHLTVQCKNLGEKCQGIYLSPSADAKVTRTEVSEHILRGTDRASRNSKTH